ncbi:helix-turn-helix transcriptional regulator [Aureimonas sp. D3]|uniref:helix-turn-helix transcriptional regulator n=1 Tax=Aureimonas sp. D3 TaxID=1638164 RepID=UPI000784C300|nr:helix-turn-helix domain-containing protein [Aureimonas sp. D3]
MKDTQSNIPRLGLNRTEVAMSLGVSVNTVDQLVKEGRLPPPRRWHTRKIWLTAEISAYLTEWPTDAAAEPNRPAAAGDDWRARA